MGKKAPERKLNIVLLDNDQTYIKFWGKICAHFTDCDHFCFSDAKTVKQFIKSHRVNLVISEIILNESDGYEIAELTHKYHPNAEVVLTTAYDCDLSRFNLKNPHFSILYKPYSSVNDIELFIKHILHKEDVFSDVSEDSFKENEVFPAVMEWKL